MPDPRPSLPPQSSGDVGTPIVDDPGDAHDLLATLTPEEAIMRDAARKPTYTIDDDSEARSLQQPAFDPAALRGIYEDFTRLQDTVQSAVQEELQKHDYFMQELMVRLHEMAAARADRASTSTCATAVELEVQVEHADANGSPEPGAAVVPVEAKNGEAHMPAIPENEEGAVQKVDGVVQAPSYNERDGTESQASKASGPSAAARRLLGNARSKSFSAEVTELSNVGHVYSMAGGHGSREQKWSDDPADDRTLKKFILSILALTSWLSGIEEPKRTGRLADFVQSNSFDLVAMLMVTLNCVFTVWTANHMAGVVQSETQEDKPLIIAGELFFCCVFLTELSLKLVVHRLYFFVNSDCGWNILDLVLVCLSSSTLVMDLLLDSGSVGVSFLRSVRVIKITRVLRMLRVVKVFRDLRMMLDALLNSIRSLIWCIVLLIFLFTCFGLLFVQLVTEYLDHTPELLCDPPGDACLKEDLIRYFGSVQQSMLSLYQATTGGLNWHFLYDLLWATGSMNGLAFIFFTVFVHFCAFNLLTGMFVEQARKAAQPDRDMLIFEQRGKEVKQTRELKAICEEFDFNKDDSITWAEFHRMIKDNKMCLYLAALGLDIPDAKLFYNMLCHFSPGKSVPIDMFVQGCMRMKGMSTSIDMQALRYEIRIMHESQTKMEEFIVQELDSMHRMIKRSADPRPEDKASYKPPEELHRAKRILGVAPPPEGRRGD